MNSVAQPTLKDDIDTILGDRALFSLEDPRKYGGPSKPTLHRAIRAGVLPVVKNGRLTRLTRETMKKILTEGIGRIPWDAA
jgi:hypothetical protein